MEPPGDPDALDRLAGRLVLDADQVRARAAAIRLQSVAVRWRSTGADEFRSALEREVTAMEHGAYELDEAASVLRAHANVVRERLAYLRAVAARAQHDLLHPGDLTRGVRMTFDRFTPW
jgi:gamma-glutamyl:cysteine ligase YbdK (ATP-grasp superfamily)